MSDKVLIIQEARLGDLIQSGPLIQRIFQSGGIPTVLVRPGVFEGARALGVAPEILSWPDFGNPAVPQSFHERIAGSRDFIRKMRRQGFSRAIVLNHHGTGIALAKALGIPMLGFDHLFDRGDGGTMPLSGWPAYLVASSRGVRALNRIHLSDMWRGFAGPGAFSPRPVPVDTTKERTGPTVVVLGGRSPFRRLAPSALSRLVSALVRFDGYSVILSGGAEDRALGEAIAAECGSQVVNTAGQTGVGELAALIAEAGVVLSPDTATLHLAASQGVPTVGLFFASAIPFETGAYREGAVSVVTREDCYPCGGEGSSCSSLSCRNSPEPDALARIVAGLRRGEPVYRIVRRRSDYLTGSQIFVARETPSGLLQESVSPGLLSKEGLLAVLFRRFVVRYLNPDVSLPSLAQELALSGMSLACEDSRNVRELSCLGKSSSGAEEDGIDPLWFVRLERGVDLYLGLRERSLHRGERERMVERLAGDFPAIWPLLHHLERVEGGQGDLPSLLRAGAALSWETTSAGRLFGRGQSRDIPEKEEFHAEVR